MANPWDKWIPGVLNRRQIQILIDRGLITGDGISSESLDNSSIDLSLSDEGFRMAHGSVKPTGEHPYSWFIERNQLGQKMEKPANGEFKLAAKQTYVFKLRERMERAIGEAGFHGQATAKSSVGRVDVLARLIVDGMDTYECFDPDGLNKQSGCMYLEITPITFPVRVKVGVKLSQLRLFYGNPKNVEIKGEELFRTILHGPGAKNGSLTVDLTNEDIGGLQVAAFCASPPENPDESIPLWKESEKPDPCRYWKFKVVDSKNRFPITESNFYLLRSKERISLPKGVAIYCRASDETIGEMRIHYAGFVHPNFGFDRPDGVGGTPLIFEVRGHQVNVSLADGEKMANLVFYRMSEDSDDGESEYGNQSLKLSKFFAEWPDKLRKGGDDGTVEPI